MMDRFKAIAATYSAKAMAAHRGRGIESEKPIFVIGMPRSGTSLVEQILASHPAVFGAGELLEMEKIAAVANFPALPVDSLGGFGAYYLKKITDIAPEARRVVDKMPFNFLYAGLIRLTLPNALIVHIRRNPVDTCLSCFSKLFLAHQPCFTYDLGELGRYYSAYRKLMAHWRKVLPADKFIELDYEDLIDDLPGQTRRILAASGLEWHPACEAFTETKRTVRTASAYQVRQPLYRSSIGRSGPYKKFLGPLLKALKN